MLGRNLMVFFLRSPASGSACRPRFSTISSFFTRHSWQDLMCWSSWIFRLDGTAIKSAMSIGRLPLAAFHWHLLTSWGHQDQYMHIRYVYLPFKPGGPWLLASNLPRSLKQPAPASHPGAAWRHSAILWIWTTRGPSAGTRSGCPKAGSHLHKPPAAQLSPFVPAPSTTGRHGPLASRATTACSLACCCPRWILSEFSLPGLHLSLARSKSWGHSACAQRSASGWRW